MSFDLTPGEDQAQILDAAAALLGSHYPVSRLRDAEGAADDLTALAEFGTFLLAMPEEDGGAGFSVVEEAQLHVALGRHLLSPAALATALAVRLARAAGRADADEIAAGAVPVCAGVVHGPDWLLVDPGAARLAVLRDGARLRLAGLPGGANVVAGMGGGRAMARLAAPDPGPASLSAEADRVAILLTAAQLLGVAAAACDLAVAYAKVREQFGRPIGSFQAVKHHCADMAIGVEMLSAQLDLSAIALRDKHADAGFQLAALARLAPRIALDNARTGIQLHGGIGFSAEADAHLYLRQAHLLRQLLPTPDLLAEASPMAPARPIRPTQEAREE